MQGLITLFGFISPNCWVEICPQKRVRAGVQGEGRLWCCLGHGAEAGLSPGRAALSARGKRVGWEAARSSGRLSS